MQSAGRTLPWIVLVAWGVALADILPSLADASARAPYHRALAALAVVALAGGAAWRRSPRLGRVIAGACALLYLVLYAARTFVFEVKPLLAVMGLPEALGGAFYVFWSFPVHELSHGELLPAISDLFRELVMPLVQAGVLVGSLARAP